MLVSALKGLKYPDEYITRFFFKEGFPGKKGNALELGCGNASNLMLFFQYGYDAAGVDISGERINYANENFSGIKKEYGLTNKYSFVEKDMLEYLRSAGPVKYDVVLLPSSVYYMKRGSIEQLLELLSGRGWLKAGGWLYIRVRTPDDFRYGKGELIEPDTYKLDTDVTGEKGCLVTFLTGQELEKTLKRHFKFKTRRLLRLNFDNIQNNHVIANSDVIFWGRTL